MNDIAALDTIVGYKYTYALNRARARVGALAALFSYSTFDRCNGIAYRTARRKMKRIFKVPNAAQSQ